MKQYLLDSILDVVVVLLLAGGILVELCRVLLGDRVVPGHKYLKLVIVGYYIHISPGHIGHLPAVFEGPDEVVVLGVDLDLAGGRGRHDEGGEPRGRLLALDARIQ